MCIYIIIKFLITYREEERNRERDVVENPAIGKFRLLSLSDAGIGYSPLHHACSWFFFSRRMHAVNLLLEYLHRQIDLIYKSWVLQYPVFPSFLSVSLPVDLNYDPQWLEVSKDQLPLTSIVCSTLSISPRRGEEGRIWRRVCCWRIGMGKWGDQELGWWNGGCTWRRPREWGVWPDLWWPCPCHSIFNRLYRSWWSAISASLPSLAPPSPHPLPASQGSASS